MTNIEDFIRYIPQCSVCEKVASWSSQDIVQYRDLLTVSVWEWAVMTLALIELYWVFTLGHFMHFDWIAIQCIT